MNPEDSLYYNTSPSSLEQDYQSRTSSSSTTQLLSPPSQTLGSSDWATQQFFGLDGLDINGSKQPIVPGTDNNPVYDNGNYQFGIPLGHVLPNYQAPPSTNQSTTLGSDMATAFQNMSTADVQAYVKQADILAAYHGLSSGSSQTIFPQQLNTNFQTVDNSHNRSPSPLNEVEGNSPSVISKSSPEMEEGANKHQRRASDGSMPKPKPNKGHNRRMSALLPVEEKLLRAQATEGLNKQDKRRVQNKLAQRAFRARSKVVNSNVQNRIDDLQKLTEDQADTISQMTEMVARLQRENLSLKTQRFEEASNRSAQP